jgi:hypothetical protein
MSIAEGTVQHSAPAVGLGFTVLFFITAQNFRSSDDTIPHFWLFLHRLIKASLYRLMDLLAFYTSSKTYTPCSV